MTKTCDLVTAGRKRPLTHVGLIID